ncbi:MAG: hypothetical protein MI921_18275 [Cytophagales bacterium]|nr:hypothetical protein [Cytophagales bacterium]
MEQLERVIEKFLLNRTLTDIEFYNINPYYFSPDPDKTWIINGGIELTFDDDNFSFGWNEKKEFFEAIPGSFDALMTDLTFESLGAQNVRGLQDLIGKSVSNLKFKWNFYQEYDEDFKLKEEKKYMPFEIIIEFNDGNFLQISAVDCEIYTDKIGEIIYDSQAQLLISLNERFEISLPDNNE